MQTISQKFGITFVKYGKLPQLSFNFNSSRLVLKQKNYTYLSYVSLVYCIQTFYLYKCYLKLIHFSFFFQKGTINKKSLDLFRRSLRNSSVRFSDNLPNISSEDPSELNSINSNRSSFLESFSKSSTDSFENFLGELLNK